MTSDRPDDSQLDEGIALFAEGAQAQAQRDFWRHYWPRRVVPLMALLAILVGGTAAYFTAQLYGRQASTETAVSLLRQQADDAKVSGDKANSELANRGQPQVPIPQPGTNVDSEVITASATARVLASLPDFHPTNAELGQAVASYLARNPVSVTPLQIATALAAYFTTSPPPSGQGGQPGTSGVAGQPGEPGKQGERGEKGDKGDPPTTAEIEAAFVQYVKEHPDVLCPNGGSFAQLTLRLADGGTADSWQCVVAVFPPSPTSTTGTGFPILPTN